jgi:hypothetical protein
MLPIVFATAVSLAVLAVIVLAILLRPAGDEPLDAGVRLSGQILWRPPGGPMIPGAPKGRASQDIVWTAHGTES